MRTGLKGAAVAAAMAVGLVSEAKAAVFTFQASGFLTTSLALFSETITGDTASTDVHFTINSSAFDFDGDINGGASAARSQFGVVYAQFAAYRGVFSSDPNYIQEYILISLYNPSNTVSSFDSTNGSATLFIGNKFYRQTITSLSFDGELSIQAYTPIPSTAPLFGAALLVLGGLGYARRRVSTHFPQKA